MLAFAFIALVIEACQGTGRASTPGGLAPASATPASSPDARTFTTFVGGTRGDRDGKGEVARFDEPGGIQVDAGGRLVVVEAGGHRVRRIGPDGTVETLAGGQRGWQDGIRAEARFDAPAGVAVRRDGSLVVADTANNRIRQVSLDGHVSTLAGDSAPGSADGVRTEARFRSPFAVALTALDEVLVADTGNHRIRLIGRDGRVSTLAGTEAGYRDGSASDARFNGPTDLAIDRFGRIYVCDLRNHVVRILDNQAGRVVTLAGNGQEGFDDGEAANARFRLPAGLDVDSGGLVYVADAGNAAIRRISAEGRVTTMARLARTAPADVAVAPDGVLYVTDPGGHRILSSQ